MGSYFFLLSASGSPRVSSRYGKLLGELDIASPDGPDDTFELVGQSDGGLVMTAHLFQAQSPGLASLLAIAVLCFSGTESMAACTNKVVSETLSPNGQLKAVVFIRECGTGVRNAHLSVLPTAGALPAEPGNTFIGEGGLSPGDDKEQIRLGITWLSDSELSVLHGVVRRVRHEGRVRGIRVYYGHLVDLPLGKWLE